LRLDDFTLYLDENLDNCKPILDILTQQNIRFERHQTHFTRGAADDLWLPFVGDQGWIVITKDKRNRYNEWEKLAVRRNKVREFYFGSGNMNGEEMATALRTALPAIRKICGSEEPPIIGSISKSGIVTVVSDKHGSTHTRRQGKARKS
jgi:hypothetical protein